MAQEPSDAAWLAQYYASKKPKPDDALNYLGMPGQGMVGMAGSVLSGLGATETGGAIQSFVAENRLPGSDTLVGQVLEGAGSTVPFLASGGAGSAASALGASAPVAAGATTATVGLLGAAAAGGGAYQRAKAAGASDDQARAAAWLTAPAGLTEVIPTARWAQKFGGILARAEKTNPTLIRRMLTEGAENALQEVGQTHWENLIAREIHSPEEAASLIEAAQVAPSSAIVGALFGAASHYYANQGKRTAPLVADTSVPIQAPPALVPLDTNVTVGGEVAPEPETVPAKPPEPVVPVPIDDLRDRSKEGFTQEDLSRQERAKELLQKPVGELKKLMQTRLVFEEQTIREQFPNQDAKWYTNVAALRAKARDPFNTEGDKAALELRRMGIDLAPARPYTAEDIQEAIWAKEGAKEVGKQAASDALAETGSIRKASIAARTASEEIMAGAEEQAGLGPLYSPMADESVLGAVVGRKMQGTLENTLPPDVKPVSKQEVMDSYLNVLRASGSNSPMLQGGTPAWAAGSFNPLNGTVRNTIWGDLATASHEIGHALERSVFGFNPSSSPWSGRTPQAGNITAKMQGELYRLGKKLYGDQVPNGGYLREGHAEYMRLWLTNHEVLMQEAPEFTTWFEREFLPQYQPISEALQAARASSDTWRRQGSHLRAQSQRYQPYAVENRLARIKTQINYNNAAQAWVRGEQAFVAFEKHVEEQLGRKLTAAERVVDMADSVRLLANSALKQQVTDYTTLEDGVTVTGAGLDDILAPIRGRDAEFFETIYALTARARWNFRAPVLDDNGKPIQGVAVADPRDPGISLEDAEHIINKADPIVLKAAWDLQAWLGRVNDLIESIDPEFGAKLKSLGDAQDALHPGGWDAFYAPLRRWIEDVEGTSGAMRAGTGYRSRVAKVTEHAKGSGRPVKDILPAMLDVVRDRIEMAYRRAPLMRMLEIATAYPEIASPFLRRVDSKGQVATQAALDAARQPLIDAGASPETLDDTGIIASFFAKPFVPPGGKDPVIPIYRNGKMEFWEVDKSVYTGLLQLNQTKLKSTIAVLANRFKNLQVMTATGLRPAFGMVLNPMVDLPVFALNTKYYTNPISALATWMKYSTYAFFDGVSDGRLHQILKDPAYDVYKKLNLEYGQSYHVNANRNDVTASRLFKGKAKRIVSPANFIDYAAQIISSTEKAGRVSEIAGALKSMKWDGKRPLKPEEVMLARVASKQVTVDFTQAGDMARQINQFVPFFNSPIQGAVGLARAAKHHPYRFAAYTAGFVGLTLALWDRNKDDEEYQELPIDERARFWHFKVTINGRTEYLRWKKPQEIAVLTSVFEELADAGYRKRDMRVNDLVESAATLIGPPIPLPPIVLEPLQLALNKDLYTGREIVPERLAGLDAAGYAYEQKGEFTSIAADKIGRMMNVSPMKVDHFMSAFFGGLGRDMLDTVGLGADLNQREKGASDVTVFGAAFKRGGPVNMQAQSFQDFYRAMSIADGRSKSKEHPETYEQGQIRKMLLDAGAAINAMQYVRDTYLKTNNERDAMVLEMAKIARRAYEMSVLGKWDPVTFQIEKQIQVAKRKSLDMNSGIIPGMK